MDEWMFKVGDEVEISYQANPEVQGRLAKVIGFRGDYGMLTVSGVTNREVLFTKDTQNFLTLVRDLSPVSENDLLEVLNL